MTFPEPISLKVNIIAGLEFELAYYDVTVYHVSYNAERTPPPPPKKKFLKSNYFNLFTH